MHPSVIQIHIFLTAFCLSFSRCRTVSRRQLTDPWITWGRADTCAGVLDGQYGTDVGSSTNIPLHDLRKCDDPILEKDGFTVMKRRLDLHKLKPFSKEYKRVLQEDSIQLVKDLTGASMAFCSSYGHRGATDQFSLEPYSLIHSDLSAEGAKFLKAQLQERYLNSPHKGDQEFGKSIKDGKRLVVFNVWRPVKIVEDNPLAICYWGSVRAKDKMEFGIQPTSHENAIQTWKYRDHQKWVYLPNQKPEEVFVFMQHDSHGKDGHGTNVPHASVVLKDQEGKPSTRQSYEFRIVVIMDDEPVIENQILTQDSNQTGYLQNLFSWFSQKFG
ncbi:hypothetical protein DFH28DRAFT_960935 [Melampsora americana]|nr:hypothetical protein DFH28DRAFT_960935 [Melampsora americana]